MGNTSLNTSLFLNSNELPIVDTIKDLGITFDSQLIFTCHIEQIVARAFTRANLIHKCFISRDTNSLTRAFVVYVRPLLEYGSSIWSPHHATKIKHVESVQRRFTKRLPGLEHMRYHERLEYLGLESLEMRRLRHDLIFTYKVVFGLVNDTCSELFEISSSSFTTRGHAYKLFKRYSRIDSRKHFFAERVIQPWNSLSAKSENFRNLASFRNFIKCVDLTNYVSLGF